MKSYNPIAAMITPGELARLQARLAELENAERQWRQTERALRESEQKFRLLFEQSKDAVLWADAATGIIVNCNRQAERLLGKNRTELIGRHQTLLHPPAEAARYAAAFHQAAASGSLDDIEAEVITPTGERRWVNISTSVVALPAGKMVQGIFHDITERKQTEQALLESEERYRRLFERCNDLVLLTDRAGVIQEINRQARALLGYSSGQLLGRSIADLHFATDLPAAWSAFQQVLEQGEVRFETRLKKADGEAAPVEISASLIDIGDGLVQGICRDITARKQAEEALRISEEKWRKLFDEAIDGIGVADMETGVLLNCNKALAQLVDRDRGELIGRHQKILHPPADRDGDFSSTFQLHRRHGNGKVLETQVITRTGVIREVEIKANILELHGRRLMQGIFRDVTERARMEQALRESEEKYRQYIENAPIGVFVADDHSRLLEMNPTACRVSGYTAAQLRRLTLADLLTPESLQTGLGYLRQLKEFGKTSGELRIRRKDGTDRILTVDAVRLAEGRYLGFCLDVTRSRWAEQERLTMERQLLRAQKLESMGVLAGGIAHDFNNILAVIIGQLDMALEDMPPFSPLLRPLLEAQQASLRAADLCRQLLIYAGKERFFIESLNLNDLIQEITRLLQVSISKRAALRHNLAAGLPAFAGDATQIRQVLMNLLINASEALGEQDGVIALSTGVLKCERAVLDQANPAYQPGFDEPLPEGPYVYCEVTDTGCGMESETQAKMFEPFFTTKFTGRGLGLAALLGIVRAHKGAIKVRSAPGRGTSIQVLFPASATPTPTASVEPVTAAKPSAWQGSGVILVVDDEQAVRALTGKLLQRLGFTVLIAAGGREALTVFQQHADDIVCVLLDRTMPDLDGEQTFRELRRLRPTVKVILCSGYNRQEATRALAGEGLTGFLQKPYQFAALREKLREALEG